MKFRNRALLCLAIYDFEAYIMLRVCLTFQGIRPSNVAAKFESLFSNFIDF